MRAIFAVALIGSFLAALAPSRNSRPATRISLTPAAGPATESELPDASIKRVALLVGSNVKPQSPGAPRAAVRLSFTPSGVIYKCVAGIGVSAVLSAPRAP